MLFRSRFFSHLERTSCLGFGTTVLVGLESAAERERLFSKVLDSGINHFDTAPYYGYGAAERFLGTLCRGRRHELSITTKFGIQPPRLLKSRLVNRLARRVLKGVPQLRGLLSKGAQAGTTRGAFSPEDARRSLEASLRALGTSYIDLFLLHEPAPTDAWKDDLVAFLNDQVAAGTIRAFGCGGEFHGIQAIAAAPSQPYPYLQFEDSLVQPNVEAVGQQIRAITYRSIATLPAVLAERFRRDPGLLRSWNEELGCDCSAPAVVGKLLIGAAVDRNREGVVLFSSTRVANIEAAVAGASAANSERKVARRFWNLARAELANHDHSGSVVAAAAR